MPVEKSDCAVHLERLNNLTDRVTTVENMVIGNGHPGLRGTQLSLDEHLKAHEMSKSMKMHIYSVSVVAVLSSMTALFIALAGG